MTQWQIMEQLYQTALSRKGADAESSYTARLFAKGRSKIAQKVGEEAVELALAAVRGEREEAIGESADLIYHLCVLWADMGIAPEEIMAKLQSREGISGIDEKNSRTS
jgi:phosphoribosyl-ATP pyrophosphohydrolase